MKQLKSSIEDLREIFEKSIKASCVTEPICSFDESTTALSVKKILDENHYDLVGVRTNGVINGYACRSDLAEGQISKYFNKFDSKDILPDTISIPKVLEVLKNSDHVFISSFGMVSGIITRGDLRKIPIRMWLFSLISLIEMQMLRIIRARYPENSWEELIDDDKIIKRAKNYFKKLRKNNEEIDLVDCLQFFDKYTIISKTEDLLKKLQCNKNDFCTFLEDLKNLRNKLAHAQDIITADWPNIIDMSTAAEEFLKTCETINGVKNHII